jgi:predicted dehydrogenase
MAGKYRVGILGLGHWYSGFGLARGLAEYPRAELVAVAERDEAKAREFGQTFGVDVYTDYDALIARDDIDIVHIAPPVVDIPDCTIKAAAAGKHMVMGKPMAMTIARAKEMVEAVEASGVVCVPFQCNPIIRGGDLKARLDSGLIGDIVLMHNRSRWSIAEDWFHSGKPGWFVDPKQVPGGAFIDEGIYAMQQILWLANSPVVKVEAKTANLVHKDIAVEDWGMATFTFANGIIATLEASWTICSPRKTGPSPKLNSNRRFEIVGTRGEIISDGLHVPELAILAKDAAGWVFERQAGDMAGPAPAGFVPYIIDCVENKRQPAGTIADAYNAFVVAMTAYESVRQGGPVAPAW